MIEPMPRNDSDPRRAEIARAAARFSPATIRARRVRRGLLAFSWWLVRMLSDVKRLTDAVVAGTALAVGLPVAALAKLALGSRMTFEGTPKVGRYGEPFPELRFVFPDSPVGRFCRAVKLDVWPVFFNIFKGDMALVGPRAAAPEELDLREAPARRRTAVRPGLICTWWIRQRTNVDYGTEQAADIEYIEGQSFFGDLALAARAVPAVFYGTKSTERTDELSVLGIRLDNLTMTESLELIRAAIRDGKAGGKPAQVSFLNPHCANVACRDREYFRALGGSALTLADGIGLKIAGKLLGREICQNVNGTDLFPRLCADLAGTGNGLYLLGGRPGVPEAVRDWLAEHHPGVTVSGLRNGYFTDAEEPGVIADIRNSGASVLLVAFGVPKQELWISRYLAAFGVPVALGVGGLFDFYSGRIPRAPLWMREIGLEWVYRLYQEPGRMWKRYLIGNATFLLRVLAERAGLWRAPKNAFEQGMKSVTK
jgi:N-acetylglucosaminyldiphosphoundecaprenol N-acetyl-beta-D-mannosaminyltransferase